MAPQLETVVLDRQGPEEAVLRIALDRPERMNALDERLARELLAALETAAGDPSVRAVTITGTGRGFCAGADLRAGLDAAAPGAAGLGRILRERYHPVILTIRRMPKPVLAALNGPAVGVGCSLALACDLVLAAESAYLLLAFVQLGLAPDGGASLLVPARAGTGRAAAMAMLGERIPAAQALAWGLVDGVVADADLPAEADALAERLAAGPTRAHAAIKAQLNAGPYAGLEAQLEREAVLQEDLAGSRDFAEGLRAFIEKRRASFIGE